MEIKVKYNQLSPEQLSPEQLSPEQLSLEQLSLEHEAVGLKTVVHFRNILF